MKAITKMLEDWMKIKDVKASSIKEPSLKEKSILLVKMMQYVEKRFPDDAELNAQFLELTPSSLRNSKVLSSPVSDAPNPTSGPSSLKVFDNSMKKRLHERLMLHHLLSELGVYGTALLDQAVHRAPPFHQPSIKEGPTDVETVEAHDKEEELTTEMDLAQPRRSPRSRRKVFLITPHPRQYKFLESIGEVKTNPTSSMPRLNWLNMDNGLAEYIWLNLFAPDLEDSGGSSTRDFGAEVRDFQSAQGSMWSRRIASLVAMNTFYEALTLCQPTIGIKPAVLKYLGQVHNLWHRAALQLEHLSFEAVRPANVIKTGRIPWSNSTLSRSLV
ncbi:hypothetical protein TCAL_16328 [Tigriopus californicus]|uniref:Uncharacterized protein n=1 Tax=Tigriopus californicus TaxID=6832 RepID=A0A553N917_TIGCA|nr:hypothetical protein TCAL_16328 [Tigriopus californicus]